MLTAVSTHPEHQEPPYVHLPAEPLDRDGHMRVLGALRRGDGHDASAATQPLTPRDDRLLPIPRYDDLTATRTVDQLHRRSQAELAGIEAYERSHRNRPEVLVELGRLRGTEPLPSYDTLSPKEISAALEAADLDTLSRVCAYEMKLHRRVEVLDELARLRRERESGGAA